ncbi:hypothetical protein E5D57_013098 [Metarhizium anisopliae]|nr:hypothetical protein E5D57_013098 [Metarhizium anisopliae]
MKEFPRKFLSLRDKNAIHRRSKSVPPGHKDKVHLHDGSTDTALRPGLLWDTFRAIFKMDGSKQNLKSDADENDPDVTKVGLHRQANRNSY